MRLLGELSIISGNVAAVQETHFTCAADCRVLKRDFVVLSAYSSHVSVGVSVFAGDGGRLIVTDVAVKSFEIRVALVYAPTIAVDRASFFSMVLFTNPSARAGYDTRLIFKRSLTGLNSEFSFS